MIESHLQNADAAHAWSALARDGLPKRPAAERVADFLEIYGLFDEVAAREQASRCVQCPEPTCVAGCPLGVHIPEWLAPLSTIAIVGYFFWKSWKHAKAAGP